MSLQSPLSRVLGSGSAKEGTEHWWAQKLTAVGLVPLTLWFALAVSGPVALAAREIDVDIHPGGRVYVLPCIAGHVGADAAAATLAEAPCRLAGQLRRSGPGYHSTSQYRRE